MIKSLQKFAFCKLLWYNKGENEGATVIRETDR